MALAFGHLVGGWIAGKCIEWKRKKTFPSLVWFFLFIGTVLPDIDYLLDWTLELETHRTFTHSLLFLITTPFILYLILKIIKNNERKTGAIALGVGILTHLLLDMLTSTGGIPLLWPNLIHISSTHVGYLDPSTPSFLQGTPQQLHSHLKLAVADMAIGTAWILYLTLKKRIRF